MKAAELIGVSPQLRRYLTKIENVLEGGLKWVVTPVVTTNAPTAAIWTRNVDIALKDDDNVVCDWFTASIESALSIADTSSAGTASIASTTLALVKGKATIVVSGDAEAWLGGISQVESITCTGAPSGNGDITLTITAAGMTGSPHDVVIPLLAATHTTVTLVADAIVEVLNADSTFAAFFVASNVAGAVAMTAITPAANDATMTFAFTDTDTTGATFGATANTTAGVAKETDTLTVAEASIAGSTVASKTSVETFEA